MKVLILGSGARENAIAWAFSRSNRISGLYIAPGNAGCQEFGEIVSDINPMNGDEIVNFCMNKSIDLVFIGSEVYLEAGVADSLISAEILSIGPNKYKAQLESSKVFSKDFMVRNNLPTAKALEFSKQKEFENFVKSMTGRIVVKKSGLAAGKGVLETESKEEALTFGTEILKTDKLLIEEFLTGFEISVFVFSDGKNYKVMPPCADFKKANEGDLGPNTGGMGAICPVPTVTSELWQRVLNETVKPTMDALNKENLNYPGIIFIGLMITSEGPKILEYNARLGDPETQSLLCLINSDFADLAEAMATGRLDQYELDLSNQVALGVVVAAEGYPGPYKKGITVDSLPNPIKHRFHIFHASTSKNDKGKIITEGGRCFTCVGLGENHFEAQKNAYRGAEEVKFNGAWFRKDIGDKFFKD